MFEWSSPYAAWIYVAAALSLLAVVVLARQLAISGKLRNWLLFVPRLAVFGLLLTVLLNPVRRSENQLPPRPAEVLYLVDGSRSMVLGAGHSRLDEVKQRILDADRRLTPADRPRPRFFQFGDGLSAAAGISELRAEDAASKLEEALNELPSRFHQELPKAVVVFSDGTVDTTGELDEIAAGYRQLGVPLYVSPVGQDNLRGDVSIHDLVVPRRADQGTQVTVSAKLRSHGYDNTRVLVQLRDEDRPQAPPLATLPLTLTGGVQPCDFVVDVDPRVGNLALVIPALEGEAVTQNNRVPFQVGAGDRTIRVLYMEGTAGTEYRWIQDALQEDPHIECLSMVVNAQYVARPRLMRVTDRYRGFPATREELFQYDVVICSDISQGAFTREQLEWTVELVAERGGGFAMVGGHTSFGAGNWDQTSWDKLIPVDMSGGRIGRGYLDATFTVDVPAEALDHPIWRLHEDSVQNRQALAGMPRLFGTNLIRRLKPAATLLGQSSRPLPQVGVMPVFACESYGRGRTFAFASDSTVAWGTEFERQWGEGDNRYFRKFWRNTVRWLAENSLSGSRRIQLETDKVIYRPGEAIQISAVTYDDSYLKTNDYRVTARLVPESAERLDARASDSLELNAGEADAGYRGDVTARLLSDSGNGGREFSTLEAVLLQVTAWDGEREVATTSKRLQVLNDSPELLRPRPMPENLESLADAAGGRVLAGGGELADLLRQFPAIPGDVMVYKTPLWDRSWLWGLIVALLGLEWSLRRLAGFG